jgi:segregation and condensation protein B
MNSLKAQLESLLFMASQPLSVKKLADLTDSSPEEVEQKLEELRQEYLQERRGINLLKIDQRYQMVSSPENAFLVKKYLKEELSGELTKPALETLTIIAYRGPITKAELEQIRGVNCSLILRNLLIKGLIESFEDKKEMKRYYQITFDFLRYLGISSSEQLPDYEKLNKDRNLEELLKEKPED